MQEIDYSISPVSTDAFCTIEQALKHLRLDDRDQDDKIITPQDVQDEVALMIDAAVAQVENMISIVYGERIFEARIDFFDVKTKFPFFPVRTITSITYTDVDGNTQTIPAADYLVASYTSTRESKLIMTNPDYPAIKEHTQIVIAGTCGVTGDVPGDIKKATRLLIGDSDTYREDRALPGTDRAVNALLRPYKY